MSLELLKVGHCRHPEAIVVRGGLWRIRSYPAIVGLFHHPQKGYILFDTGYAKRFQKSTNPFPERLYRLLTPVYLSEAEELLHQLSQRGIAAEDIKYIFISHFHADHIAGLLDFPAAQFICSEDALKFALHQTRLKGLMKGYLPTLIPADIASRTIFIEECKHTASGLKHNSFEAGYDIFSDGSHIAISLPGHAQGHYGLLTSHDNMLYFLVGDACWTSESLKNATKPLAIANIIMSCTEQYNITIESLSQLHSSMSNISIIPSHCQQAYKKYSQGMKSCT